MGKTIQFKDVLGNIVQIKTGKDVFKEVKEEDCWVIEGRKIFPVSTDWDYLHKYEGKYFKTEEAALETIEKHIAKYEENARKVIKDFRIQVEEVIM